MEPSIVRRYFIRYVFEFIAIVMGITASFILEDYRENEELKTLSEDLTLNLMGEVSEIENYIQEREIAFKGDKELLDVLRSDTLDKGALSKTPSRYKTVLFNYRGFHPPVAFYHSMINDGKIRYLESKELKKLLDEIHNVHFLYITANIEDEAVSQRKIIDYFQFNYPNLIIQSESKQDNADYVEQLKTIVEKDDVLKALLFQKALAMTEKIIGFDKYKASIAQLKKVLQGQVDAKLAAL
ncbi:hypothetical protein N8873_08935 [Flavobacteriaceae bacterium]|jgi:hypothetical protein|nr:hypothetical protein [Flavobacteriaceae bacterium]